MECHDRSGQVRSGRLLDGLACLYYIGVLLLSWKELEVGCGKCLEVNYLVT
jgi:hypothetical protein